ncbi:DoxX family protein [Gordonia soli]|uniref:DoxX family protein n=1 Tax=Gordonia soli NBRC 108243 TaxID=1223545 RepID=M0QMP8_9ACTN|nr:hypothetical protein [Gordonia soli]GAC68692.1 hypothetical protein GS4_17_00800 [Gordonia soli NBRC 108243]
MTTREIDVPETTRPRTIARYLLAAALVFAGLGHLFWARKAFQAQVPDWVPLDKDAVVVASGGVEIMLGGGLAVLSRDRVRVGRIAALFFAAVFPGNIAQWRDRRSAFGLDTDEKRLVRLFFQPVLIAWALWSTGTPKKR